MQVEELQITSGVDISLPQIGLTIRQPRIKEIAMMGESNYFLALSLWVLSKAALKIQEPTISEYDVFSRSLKQQMQDTNIPLLMSNFLQLFSTEKLIIGPRSLILDKGGEIISLTDEQFALLRDTVGQVAGASLLKGSKEEEFKPKNGRAAEIAEKMKKARRRKEQMQPKPKTKSFLSKYILSVAAMTANSFEDINQMTLLQLDKLYRICLAREEFGIEIKSRLAGAKGEDKLKHWSADPEEDAPPVI